MARKKAKRSSMKKIQPSVLTMGYSIPDGISTIDLSQSASILNRRFYRQGINWVVAGFRVFTPTPVTDPAKGIKISRLPNTWTMSNSWEKAFRSWNAQQMTVIRESGAESAVAAFRDFKVHMDETHVTAGFAGNLLPIDDIGSPSAGGEWLCSEIVIPNANGVDNQDHESALHVVGANFVGGATPSTATSRGIIEGYADSRAYPQSPDPISPPIQSVNNWMRDMFDVGNEADTVSVNATDRNDQLPYTQINYPGGETQLPGLQIVDAAYFSAGTNSNKLYMKGDNFPCGLLRIVSTADVETNLLIDLVPGQHKGYLCQKMTDM